MAINAKRPTVVPISTIQNLVIAPSIYRFTVPRY
jgi:hypothetical protein